MPSTHTDLIPAKDFRRHAPQSLGYDPDEFQILDIHGSAPESDPDTWAHGKGALGWARAPSNWEIYQTQLGEAACQLPYVVETTIDLIQNGLQHIEIVSVFAPRPRLSPRLAISSPACAGTATWTGMRRAPPSPAPSTAHTERRSWSCHQPHGRDPLHLHR
ncbi:hypothetical protein PG985_009763 [Apiospora marii]|uniref:uncharacterized protein n=1 Tax=Apiospora marii TaxID=335849 RepID=UPI00312EB043